MWSLQKFPFVIVIFIFLIIGSAQASPYTVDTYRFATQIGSVTQVQGMSLFSDDLSSCNIASDLKINKTGGNQVVVDLYSPDAMNPLGATAITANTYLCGTLIPKSFSNNTNFDNNLTYNMDANSTLLSGTGNNFFLSTSWSCPNAPEFIDIDYADRKVDDRTFSPNIFHVQDEDTFVNGSYIASLYSVCSSINGVRDLIQPHYTVFLGSGSRQDGFFVPINSGSGNVSVDLDGTFTDVGNVGTIRQIKIVAIRASTGTTSQIGSTFDFSAIAGSGLINISGSVNGLAQNELYFIEVASTLSQSILTSTTYVINSFRTHIDFRVGNFVCGAFTECLNSTKSRLCEDTSIYNKPSYVETQTCFTAGADQTYKIGFEETNPPIISVLECFKSALTCNAYVNRDTQFSNIEYPTNWTIDFPEVIDAGVTRFHEIIASLTTLEKHSGSYSLEMNYRPAIFDYVTEDPVNNATNPAVCAYQSTFNASTFNGNVHATNLSNMVRSAAFQFPINLHPGVQWWVKKDTTPKIQYSVVNTIGCLAVNSNYTRLCWAGNYEPDCSLPVRGNYILRVVRYNGSTSFSGIHSVIATFAGDASTDWRQNQIDLDPTGLSPSALYGIEIYTNPSQQYQNSPIHLYFDDVEIVSRSTALIDICETNCTGNDLHVASLQGNSCFIEVIANESSCVLRASVLAAQAAAAAAAASQTSNFEPLAFFNITTQQLEDSGLGGFGFFASPFFIFLGIFIVAGAYLDYKIGGRGMVLALVLAFGILAGSIIGIVPVWMAITLIVIAGMFTYFIFSKGFNIGGSG